MGPWMKKTGKSIASVQIVGELPLFGGCAISNMEEFVEKEKP